MPNVFCTIGLHKWSKWSVPLDEIGGSLASAFVGPRQYQRRVCQSCGFIDDRNVITLMESPSDKLVWGFSPLDSSHPVAPPLFKENENDL